MKEIFDILKNYVDEYNLITQLNKDGGDTTRNEGMWIMALNILGLKTDPIRDDLPIEIVYAEANEQLESGGKWRRHPGPKWYKDWLRFTRDQLITTIIKIGLMKDYKTLFRTWFHHMFGFFKYKGFYIPRMGLWMTNTKNNFVYSTFDEHVKKSTPDVPWDYEDKWPDFTGPEIWALYVRAFGPFNLIPILLFSALGWYFNSIILFSLIGLPGVILYLGDTFTLLGSYWKIKKYKGDDDGNHLSILINQRYSMPTSISNLPGRATGFIWMSTALSSCACLPECMTSISTRRPATRAPPGSAWRE